MRRGPVREFLRRRFGQYPLARKADAALKVAFAIPPTDYWRVRKLSRIRAVFPYSMCGYKRLANVYDLATRAEHEHIPGAFVECGVWKGGCIGLMASVSRDFGSSRKIVLFDSFEGLPPPDPEKYPADKGDIHHLLEPLAIPLGQVRLNFERYGLLDDQVRFLKGWFRDTLPGAPIERLAVLRLDADLYDSTLDTLRALYHRVSPGGYVIVDDYQSWRSCRKAVTDFRAEQGIDAEIKLIDRDGAYWQVTPR